MAAGSISRVEFQSLVKDFVNISNLIDDKWHLVTGINSFYMSKKQTTVLKTSIDTKDNDNATLNSPNSDDIVAEMEMDNVDDVSCMSGKVGSKTLTYEYHVVYSDSYAVPVLYFNIYLEDGRLLSLDEVWHLCPSHYQDYLKENKWATLTQQEHPLMGRPFLQLHPCHTVDLMTQVKSEAGHKRNYLATWLSTVGPMVGLQIPPAYITTTDST